MERDGKDAGDRLETENATTQDDRPRKTGTGYFVMRNRLLHEVETQGRSAGVTLVCAPDGFGKTALLIQYVSRVRDDPARADAMLFDAGPMMADELVVTLDRATEAMEPRMHPLIAIDNLPLLGEEGVRSTVRRMRAMRESGFEFIVSCTPSNRLFTQALSDSYRVGAQALKVQPFEYSEWARAFSIAKTLDVYELTQGVPALVALLQTVTGSVEGTEALSRGVAALYHTALEELRQTRDPLYRLASLFVLMGRGKVADLERGGLRPRADALTRLARDYPLFGFDLPTRAFCCMGMESKAIERLRKDTAARRSTFAMKVARILMLAGRVDDAVARAGTLLDAQSSLELVGQYPVRFAMTGNAAFVNGVVSRLEGAEAARVPVGVVLAVYLSALVSGEYRVARSMCSELRRRAHDIQRDIDEATWFEAQALSEVWGTCNGVELPQISFEVGRLDCAGESARLRAHCHAYRRLLGADGGFAESDVPHDVPLPEGNAVDIPSILLDCDHLLHHALHGDVDDPLGVDRRLQDLAHLLIGRHLMPVASRVRMVAATCRLMSGLPIVDERAFTDAGTFAVRESDFATQLFCLLGEGWQATATSQMVTAQFRAQQVLRLASEEQSFLRAWAHLLERSSYILNTARLTMCGDADLLDLSQERCDAAEAWGVALHLSAICYDSELSAWYSMHKAILLEKPFRPLARLAMATIGDRATSIRRLLPWATAPRYLFTAAGASPQAEATFEVLNSVDYVATMGQVTIGLFGGFKVERNGHTITADLWKRKKASTLAARLVLALGSFVSRRIITEEIWPDLEYPRARENLYVTASTLRNAFGQQTGGPQYLLAQGDGLGLNREFVSSDTARFDVLAREVLLKRTGTSSRQIIETCLKIEQIYTGPLFVPDVGDAGFFIRMRRSYMTKFVDCMLRGVEVALEADDMPSASWLIEAALRQAPMREDVIRCAMRIYDMSGRRREVVELYNSHLHYLEHELSGGEPEEETRLAYESIIGKAKLAVMM